MTKRTDRIIHILLSKPNGMKIHELGEMLNVSDRTIRNELKTINSIFSKSGLSDIYQNRGFIRLDHLKDDLNKIEDLRILGDDADYYSPKERFVILLFDVLIKDTPVFVYQEQAKLKISKSTIDEDMRVLRSFLERYSLKAVTSAKGGVQIEGAERSIRMMIADAITQNTDLSRLISIDSTYNNIISNSIERLIPVQLIEAVKKIYSDEIQKVGSTGNVANDYQLILHSCVWIQRILSDRRIVAESHDKWVPRDEKIINYVNKLSSDFKLENIDDTEFRYIYFVLNSFNSNMKNTNSEWVETQILTMQLVTYMEKQLSLPLSTQEDLYEGLYNHLTGLVYRLHERIQSYNPLKQIIKTNYPDIYGYIDRFMNDYFKDQDFEVSDDEICYITVYFGTAEMQIERDQEYKYRVAVVCNYGLATGHLLAANLEKKFNIEVLAVLSVSDIKVLSKLSIDLVVKTIQVETGSIPSIKLPPIPQESDYLVINNFLKGHKASKRSPRVNANKLFDDILGCVSDTYHSVTNEFIKDLSNEFRNNNLFVNKKEVQPMLEDLLTDDRIQIQKKVDNWKEAIQLAAQPLVDDNVINDHYVHAMLEAVIKFGPYIVIGPGLALAHARPEEGANQLGVSVLTLSTPVNFGNKDNDPVSLVFCLSAVNNYSHLNIMKAIVQLVSDPGRIEKLSGIKDLESFKETLFEKKTQNN
ncbi:BglG family transcription antiterminator [Companilactobacillus jidongensis]|uniref:BglG family transcription antiterminator n=1 Tax=Companilactobacillus jidongensis TaxID=2486006 RepID=UPI000F7B5A03|nr:PTS sugar transporter subunit IIA [Companilactobacillus jidongensis]